MTYRNNLDAAVARGDALQQEVKRLAAENASLRAKPKAAPRRSTHMKAIGSIAALGVAAIAGVVALSSVGHGEGGEAAASGPDPAIVTAGTVGKDLVTCAELIIAPPTDFPRDAEHVTLLEQTGAQCRRLLRETASVEPALMPWANAEDVLGNRISLIREYVAGGPYTLDQGRSAGQLWREYRDALRVRDTALHAWRSRS